MNKLVLYIYFFAVCIILLVAVYAESRNSNWSQGVSCVILAMIGIAGLYFALEILHMLCPRILHTCNCRILNGQH